MSPIRAAIRVARIPALILCCAGSANAGDTSGMLLGALIVFVLLCGPPALALGAATVAWSGHWSSLWMAAPWFVALSIAVMGLHHELGRAFYITMPILVWTVGFGVVIAKAKRERRWPLLAITIISGMALCVSCLCVS